MPTVNKIITGNSKWQLVTSADDFQVTNESAYPIKICFSSSLPNASINGHTIRPIDGVTRGSFTGNLYASADHIAMLAVTEQ